MKSRIEAKNVLQVIVAAMNQEDSAIIERMNIRSNALVCNQCSRDSREVVESNGNKIIFLNSTQRGVGRNRNNGIADSSGDILLFADEDVRYHDDYVEIIQEAYKKNPKADMIVFNVKRLNDYRKESRDNVSRRVHWFSSLRYGAIRISVRRASLLKANVWFSLLFGGGAEFGFGEDSLFMSDCIKRGLRVYASDKEIGIVDQASSSWFEGYNRAYFRDKGVLFRAISKNLFYALTFHYLLKHGREFQGISRREVFKLIVEGKVMFKNYPRKKS